MLIISHSRLKKIVKDHKCLLCRGISRYLFVKNLPTEVTEADLNNLFKKYGVLKQMRILPATVNSSSQKALLEYASLSSAINVHDELDGSIAFGRRIHVDFPMDTKKKRDVSET
jgi:RNA recognition motif-containing protein